MKEIKGGKDMSKVIFVIGANATGKSYFIKERYNKQNIIILDVFDYQQRAYDAEGYGENDAISFYARYRCLMLANLQLLSDILKNVKNGQDVVVEQTFYKAKRRISFIDEIRKTADVSIEVYVMSPSDKVWESNLKKRNCVYTMENMKREAENIEFPNPSEGFDAIYEVIDGTIKLCMNKPTPEIVEPAREEIKKERQEFADKEEKRLQRKELMASMETRPFWHYCEVCGKKKYMTAQQAYEEGWDYPPRMGKFGLLGPRKCGNCRLTDTLFWKINTEQKIPVVIDKTLSNRELQIWNRIKNEPESLLSEEKIK